MAKKGFPPNKVLNGSKKTPVDKMGLRGQTDWPDSIPSPSCGPKLSQR